ncbi:hypothetical protein RIF29_16029 [Crotalaria pallida]|uniref:Uncharacterized protein n=1 Tax=Crotalaria pallida TaxID=3830 RepID=A0AAN9ID54_CROPI
MPTAGYDRTPMVKEFSYLPTVLSFVDELFVTDGLWIKLDGGDGGDGVVGRWRREAEQRSREKSGWVVATVGSMTTRGFEERLWMGVAIWFWG